MSKNYMEYIESKTDGGIMSEQQGNLFSQDYNSTPFMPEPQDFSRWSKHGKAIFNALRDRQPHSREYLVEQSGSLNVASRVSEIRKRGFIIVNSRASDAGATTFQMTEFVGYDTTGRHRCPTCTCKSGSKE